MRGGNLNLFDVVHDGRHQLAGGMGFKELRALPHHLVEDAVAKIGDGGHPDVVHQVVTEVVADAFDREHGHDGECHHRPEVVYTARDELVEVDGVMRDGNREQRHAGCGGGGIQHAVEYG